MTVSHVENIAFFHGRFQPFHLGHLQVVKHALQSSALLVIGVSNPFRLPPVIPPDYRSKESESLLDARDPENNPWPYWARVLMIREGLRSEGIDLADVVFIPNLNSTGLPVDEMRFPKSATSVYLCPKGEHNKAIARKYRRERWNVVEVPLSQACLGSGVIRQRLRTNGQWEELVPKGTAEVIEELRSHFDIPAKHWFAKHATV